MIINVTNSAGLYAATKAAVAGDQILLAPGSYSMISLSNFNPTSAVTIASLDPTNPAKVSGIYAVNSSNVTFKNLDVSVDPRQIFAVTLGSDKNMIFDNLSIHGTGAGDGNGVMVRNSTGITIKNSEIHDIGTGLSHINSSNVVFSNNKFHDLQADAIHGGGTSNITISGNYFTNFFPKAGDHPDAIQFWTTGTTTSARDIVVTDNVVVRGEGSVVQGVFIGSETGLVYQNVTITGNTIVGGMYNGIALSTANNVKIADNVVQGYQDMTSWISFQKTTNAVVTNNTATMIKNLGANTGLTFTGNTTITTVEIGDISALRSSLLGTGTSTVTGSTPVPGAAPSATSPPSSEPGLVITHAGTTADNRIVGSSGADTIDGKAGADTMSGGLGNDTYVVDNAKDMIVEARSGGVDTVVTKLASYTLGSFVENVRLTGTSSQIANGNELDNVMTDNGFKSTLIGGLGNDTLVANGGADVMTGGAGRDVFDFNKIPTGVTTITDFTKGQDSINLHDLLGNYHGSNPVADGWVKFQADAGGTTVFVDADGAGAGGFVAIAKLTGFTGTLTAGSDWIF